MTDLLTHAGLAVLVTGGTLDKVHDTETESLIFSDTPQSHVSALFEIGRCQFPRIEVLFKIDSLEMTDNHRARILKAVLSAPERHIVVTHGTGTLELTAKYLEGKTLDKTVVLTGAMRPFSLGRSDAGYNMGGAIIGAQTLPSGVYAVMNGRVFPASDVRKNTKLGRFDA